MKPSPKILVIDDEPQILRALKTILGSRHFQVVVAHNGEEGLAVATAQQPDVIILDLGLPDLDGVEVCRRFREWTQTPIIVLSVRDSEREKVQALDAGADDFLTKPFGIDELIARIRVALRHSVQAGGGNPQPVIRSGALVIDLVQHTVLQNGEEVHLTATEYKLLAYMARNAGRVLSHQAILVNTWGNENRDRVEYLRVYVRQLRIKLEPDPENPITIINEPGIGYRFLADG